MTYRLRTIELGKCKNKLHSKPNSNVISYNYFHVVFILHQKLNLLENKYFLSNLQKKNLLFLLESSHNNKKIFSFLLSIIFHSNFDRCLSVIIATFKNI